jgi:multiple sugar transport system permease protein
MISRAKPSRLETLSAASRSQIPTGGVSNAGVETVKAMLRSKRTEILAASMLMAPFVVTYGVLFIYPTIKMAQLSLTNAPLIGPGKWVGLDNYFRLASDRLFSVAIWNTLYFVILSVIPSTLIGLLVALGVNRLKGWLQSVVLAAFFLPYVLPVSVVFRIWQWMCDKDFGIAQHVVQLFNNGERLSIFRTIPLFMPAVAIVTIWWLIGFNVLLFIAGLRNISHEIYEAAELDGAGRWIQFRRITWPLIWPVTVLVFTIQLILQLKIFDQVYLFAQGGRIDTTIVMVQYILKQAFQMNKGGLAAAASMVLFVLIAALSVLQFQLLRARGDR